MARLRLPRFPFLGRRDDNPERDEHEKLVLIAEVAGFVVVTSIIATFVLMVANSSGGQAARPNPAVPTITDVGGPAVPEVEPAPPVAKPTKAIPPPAVGERAAAVKAKPKPKPTTSSSTPTSAPPQPQVPFADPYDRCAPDGARAFTPRLHYPLECRDGRWRFDGDDGGDHDGDDDHGNGHGHGR